VFKSIAIETAKIRRPGTGAGIGNGAAMGIAKFFILQGPIKGFSA